MNTIKGFWQHKNGKIYAIGGGLQGVGFSTVEEYDPATDTWTKKADMPTGRFALSTSVVNGKIYAIGGNREAAGPRPVTAATAVGDPRERRGSARASCARGR